MKYWRRTFLKTIFHIEQPIANPNSIAKQVLSRLVRSKGYKVCLTGEGSDEVFGGYAYFKLERIWRMLLAGGEQARQARALWKQFKKLEIAFGRNSMEPEQPLAQARTAFSVIPVFSKCARSTAPGA